MAKKTYKVTYSGTRAFHTYSSKKAALQVACVKRRKRRAR